MMLMLHFTFALELKNENHCVENTIVTTIINVK